MKVLIPFHSTGSTWRNNELRYCLRSICQFVPDNDVLIIGNPPEWYNGNFHPFKDLQGLNFKTWNILQKILSVCLDEDFLLMNDDIYLLAPFAGNHYKGRLFETHAGRPSYYRKQVLKTYEVLGDVMDYDSHAPMMIDGSLFMRIEWPEFTEPYILMKTYYQSYAREGTHYPDLKITERLNPEQIETLLKDRLYFSTGDNIHTHLENYFKKTFPNPCKYEK